MIVLDSSAALAYLQGETGSDVVAEAFGDVTVCGAANWSEIANQVRRRQGDWGLSAALLASRGLRVEPVTREDAELAAQLAATLESLSLGDRLCLALAERLDCAVLTADQAWGASGRVRQIR